MSPCVCMCGESVNHPNYLSRMRRSVNLLSVFPLWIYRHCRPLGLYRLWWMCHLRWNSTQFMHASFIHFLKYYISLIWYMRTVNTPVTIMLGHSSLCFVFDNDTKQKLKKVNGLLSLSFHCSSTHISIPYHVTITALRWQ